MKKKSIHLLTVILLAVSGISPVQIFADCSGGEAGPGCTTTTTVTILDPPHTYLYCGNESALNKQSPLQCSLDNSARAIDTCVRNDTICRYQDTDFQTLCLQKTFSSMPDFSNINLFNAENTLCTKWGAFIFSGSTANGGITSFYGICSNGLSVDTDLQRCTYVIQGTTVPPDIVSLPPTISLPPEDTTTTNTTTTTTTNSTTTDTGTGTGTGTPTDTTTSGTTDTGTSGTGTDSTGGTTDSTSTTDSTTGGDTGGVTSVQTYSITWVVVGNGSGLGNIEIDVLQDGELVRQATTDIDWSYTVSGLQVGAYEIRPRNINPFIFPTPQLVSLNNTDIRADFSGINANTLEPNIAQQLLQDSIDASSGSQGLTLSEWLEGLTTSRSLSNTGIGTSDIADTADISSASVDSKNIFSENSIISLLEKGYTLESTSYSSVPLSIINRYANQNAICGNSIQEEGETCDDGVNNGKPNYCSADCLYIGEVRFTADSAGPAIVKKPRPWSDIEATDTSVLGVITWGVDAVFDVIDDSQEWAKQKIIANTSPRTRRIIKQTAVVVEEVAKYSVIGVTSLLGALWVSLHVLVFKSQWISYTVQEWDTLDSLWNKFTMTGRALKKRNARLRKWGLRPGMKLKVRNRHFIEKDYLDQLKFVLKDVLEKRHYGRMSAKIDKMFAKK